MDKLSVDGLGQAIRNSTVMMELAAEELARLLRENAELKAEVERLRANEELHRRAIDAGADYVKELKAKVERLRIENDHNDELMGKLDAEAWRVLAAIGKPMPRGSSFWEAATELPGEVERLHALMPPNSSPSSGP
jgi:chromosome segregation ATPase